MTNNSGDKRIKEQVGNMQVSFDKEAAWMRLQDRMESKDEKKPYFRIAWAAAALLVATTCWYAFTDTKDVTVAKEIPEAATPLVKEQPAIQPRTEEIAVSNTQPIIAIKKHTVLKKQQKTLETIKELTPVPEPMLVKEEEEPAPVPEPVKLVARPKPKMRTVHINDVMQEEYYERILSNSRYAVENNPIFHRLIRDNQDNISRPNNHKKSFISYPNEDYRIIQN